MAPYFFLSMSRCSNFASVSGCVHVLLKSQRFFEFWLILAACFLSLCTQFVCVCAECRCDLQVHTFRKLNTKMILQRAICWLVSVVRVDVCVCDFQAQLSFNVGECNCFDVCKTFKIQFKHTANVQHQKNCATY